MEPNYTPIQPQRSRRADRYRQAAAQAQAQDEAQQQAAPQQAMPQQAAPQQAAPQQPTPRQAAPQQVAPQQPTPQQPAPQQPDTPDQPAMHLVTAYPPQTQSASSPYAPPAQQQASQQPRSAAYAQPRSVQQPVSAQPRSVHYPVSAQPRSMQYPPLAESEPQPMHRNGMHRDHMLQSPETSASSARPVRKKPLPTWFVPVLLIVILLGTACFTGRMLMNSYLHTQQEARVKAQLRVVEAHPIQYADLIQRYAMEYNLQPAFVAAIILNESSFNTHAESSVGARGLMQLMPDTAQWIAHKLGQDNSYHTELLWQAETNIRYGCWYLSYLSRQFSGDPVTVASAYHTGQGEVTGWLGNRTYSPDGRALSLASMPDGPTKVYAGKVTRDYAIYDALYFHAFNALPAEDAL